MNRLIWAAACGLAVAAWTGSAEAGKLISPVAVKIDIGGEAGFPWRAANMINQTGLDKNYLSGVTDFDAYIASNPIHNMGPYSEWASATPVQDAQITFDFGSVVTLGTLALWDEDQSSLTNLRLSSPEIGAFANFAVKDSRAGASYGAQLFQFAPIETRYLTMNLSGCGSKGYNHDGCGIGEVAFRTVDPGAVPEPGTWAMLIVGFGAVGGAMRISRRRPAALIAA